jgi:hypothetical protein
VSTSAFGQHFGINKLIVTSKNKNKMLLQDTVAGGTLISAKTVSDVRNNAVKKIKKIYE